MLTITGLEELKAAEGEELGICDWHEVTQEAIDAFADVTGDHQWIHVDAERAEGDAVRRHDRPRLLHALASRPMFSTSRSSSSRASRSRVNYGLNKVRFPAPLPVGVKVRMRAEARGRRATIPGGAQITIELTFEREGGEKPVCVAETLARVYAG